MEFATFPKNLAYNIKTLSGFSKTCVKITPDKTSVNANDTFKVKLPTNTIVDLRTLTWYAKGNCVSNTGDNLHFPRLGLSSLIKTLAVYVNGTLIERIDNYNILYNKLFDLEGGIDQVAKRHLEIADPSVRYSTTANHTAATPEICTLAATGDDTNRKMAVSSWIGFLSNNSCPCPDTNDLGNIELEITLANEQVLFAGASGTVNNDTTKDSPTYNLTDIYFTVSKIVFNDPLYYNMKASKLLSSGLQIGYQTYIASKGSVVAKNSSVNVNCTVNSTSLDQLICCFNPGVPVISPLLLNGSNDGDNCLSFQQASSGYGKKLAYNGAAFTAGAASTATFSVIPSIEGQTSANIYHNSAGDLYNQSYFFKSDAIGIQSSSIEINNTPLAPQPMEPEQIFTESLISLGNANIDMAAGVHSGLRSLSDFLKYYFCHIVSLENIQHQDFYKSGLDGKSSALNIVWKLAYSTTGTMSQTPYIFAKTTRVLQINEGGSIVVIV
jgi:hypothetical protein